MSNTVYLIAGQYGMRPAIPLEDIARDYLGLDRRAAFRAAIERRLPFPAFRGESNKSPWMVSTSDFANWLDAQAANARAIHTTLKVA